MVPAVIWMLGTILSFCLMAIGARELSDHIGTFQVLFARSVIGLIVITVIIVSMRRVALLKTQQMRLHTTRNLFHFAGQYGWFVGIGLLPLAEVFALEFTVPIWTVLIAVALSQERLTLRKCTALAFGMAGVLLIVRPGVAVLDPASFVVLAAAACYAMAYVTTKSLSVTEHPLTVVFYMCLVQLPIGALLTGTGWVMPAPIDWFWLSVVGITALTAHYCITRAMQLAEAGTVVTLDFLRLPLIALFGVVLYQEPFDLWLLLGAGLMLFGNLINLQRSKQTA